MNALPHWTRAEFLASLEAAGPRVIRQLKATFAAEYRTLFAVIESPTMCGAMPVCGLCGDGAPMAVEWLPLAPGPDDQDVPVAIRVIAASAERGVIEDFTRSFRWPGAPIAYVVSDELLGLPASREDPR